MEVRNEILEELRSLSALVASISRQTPYRVPEAYFERFSGLVLSRVAGEGVEALSFETEDKPLTFSVPEGFFEGFAQRVLDRVKAGSGAASPVMAELQELSPVLARIARRMPYQLPEGYFEGLSPILAVIREQNPYVTPEGYFERLPAQLAARAAVKKAAPAKVISLGSFR